MLGVLAALTGPCRPFATYNLWIHALHSAMSKVAPLRTLHVLLLAVAVVLFGLALLLRQGGGLCAQRTGPLFFETSWLSGGTLRHVGDAGHHSGSGSAGDEQQPGQQGCPTSEEVAASPWASSCYHLTKVCVDNGETCRAGICASVRLLNHCCASLPAVWQGLHMAVMWWKSNHDVVPKLENAGRSTFSLAGGLILYDDRFQPSPHGGGEQAPSFAAEDNYGQYIYVYRNGVRCMRRLCTAALAGLSWHALG